MADLIDREKAFLVLRKAQIASCTCQIKTPDPDWHNHNCRYRILREVEAMIDHLPDAALPAVTLPDDVAGVVEEAGKVLEGVTPGRVVQFHPSFCKEAEGAPFSEWDTSHDLSVIQPDGKRYRIGSMRHANDAAFFQWCREGVPALIALATAQAAQIAGLTNGVGAASQMALDYIDRAEAAEAERNNLSDKLELERALTDGAHRRAAAAETALAASEARVAKLVEALKVARAHVANNADGWSVSRGAARVDLTIVDAAITEAGQ